MTPEFKEQLKGHIQYLKTRGDSAEESLREAEMYCSKANVEFRDYGREVVETVYGGKFTTRAGGLLGFDPDPEQPVATPTTPPTPAASTATTAPAFDTDDASLTTEGHGV
jgi:hypothetical protein